MLANAIACFEAQTYPLERRRLIVLDDSGELPAQQGPSWEIVSTAKRFESLPAKYNAMAAWDSNASIYVVWEDDDIYLSHHIEAHVAAMQSPPGLTWSHPSKVWSLYSGKLEQEQARGRLHASLAMDEIAFDDVGGWPDTKEAQFDLMLLANLRRELGDPADPCDHAEPSYVFRWGSTNCWHGQNFMHDGPHDTTWYDRAADVPRPARGGPIVPKLDDETQRVYREVSQ